MSSRIFSLFAFIAALGVFFAYIHPTWTGSIATMKAAIASDDQALVAASDYAARESKLATAQSAINPEDLERLEVLLPDSVNNVGIILNLNTLAARSGLAISSINVLSNTSSASTKSPSGALSASASGNAVSSVDLLLSASGSYSALRTFLEGVEKSARLLDVRDLVVKGSNSGIYSYQMTLRLYWLR